MVKKKKPTISAIDVFCGAGGLTHGLILGGVKVRAGIDTDAACEYPFEHNNKGTKFINADVKEISSEELATYYKKGDVKMLAGCAPCQPFSTFRNAYKKKRRDDADKGIPSTDEDDRWSLLKSFARLVQELDPDIVTMENVPQLCKHKVFDEFVSFLETNKYQVTHEIVDCSKYGIPQRRKRLVLLASKKGKIKLPDSSKYRNIDNSVRKAIGSLPSIKAGGSDPSDSLHKSRKLTDINLKRIQASKAGGTWEDWDVKLRPACYLKESGESFKSVYGRMKWSDPSPVITTQFYNYGTGRFGHPKQDRAISLREAALLQTFPPDYSFVRSDEVVTLNKVGRLIGNAVPPKLSQIVASAIVRHVADHYATV